MRTDIVKTAERTRNPVFAMMSVLLLAVTVYAGAAHAGTSGWAVSEIVFYVA